jgi:hypothetical protein
LRPLSETGGRKVLLQPCGSQKFFENFFEKFADSKKVTTFAIPIARKGLASAARLVFLAPELKRVH